MPSTQSNDEEQEPKNAFDSNKTLVVDVPVAESKDLETTDNLENPLITALNTNGTSDHYWIFA